MEVANQHASISKNVFLDTLFQGKGEIPRRIIKTLIYTKYIGLDLEDN